MLKKIFPFVFLACFLFGETTAQARDNEDWIFMPAGAKPSYMGIHGGTMPVSLLVSDDGASLLAFVGRTGNDFIEDLRNVHLPIPSFGNSTGHGMPRMAGQTGIFAGNATAVMPVFPIRGDGLADFNSRLEPFGLSQEPLRIEGRVEKPDISPRARNFRVFFLPDYFKPRRDRAGK